MAVEQEGQALAADAKTCRGLGDCEHPRFDGQVTDDSAGVRRTLGGDVAKWRYRRLMSM